MSRKNNKKWKTIAAFGATTAVLLGVFASRALIPEKPPLNEITLCPSTGETHRTSILIDKSDAWGPNDISRVNSLLSEAYTKVGAQERLTIYGIIGEDRKSTEVKRYFDFCNPGSETECNALYDDCGAAKKRYDSQFSEPLKTLADELKLPGKSSFSPLLESVSEIVDEAGEVPLDILIVSDMMENHFNFVFYDVVPLPEEIVAEYPLDGAGRVSARLKYIQRSRHSRELESAVLSAWKTYFESQGISVDIDRLFVAE